MSAACAFPANERAASATAMRIAARAESTPGPDNLAALVSLTGSQG